MNIKAIGLFFERIIFHLARADKRALPQTDRLNIGSAYVVAPGWANLDNSPSVWLSKHNSIRYILQKMKVVQESAQQRWPSDIVFHDVRHRLPWPDQSLQYIYCSHLLEHLSRRDGERLLRDCYRVLKSGATMRVVVPDLLLYARQYIEAIAKTDANHDNPYAVLASEKFLEILGVHSGIAISSRNPHRWMYDASSLAHCLAKAGFEKIEQKKYRDGRVPDLEILDIRPDDSLHMEARRL